MHSLIFTADHHTGNTVALWPRGVTLPDGGLYSLNPTQRWLWDYWLRVWDEVEEYTRSADVRIWIVDGDYMDCDLKSRTHQYITKDLSVSVTACTKTLEPGMARVQQVYFIRGTDAHAGIDGEYEELIASDCDLAQRDGNNCAAWQHLRLVVDRLRLDVSHKTGMSGIPRTFANSANTLAADTIASYAAREQAPPHLVVRAHVHKHADSGSNFTTRAVILPAWMSRARYMKDPNRLADVGAVCFLVEGDRIIGEREWITKLESQRLWTRRA